MNLHQIHNSNIPNFRSISLSFHFVMGFMSWISLPFSDCSLPQVVRFPWHFQVRNLSLFEPRFLRLFDQLKAHGGLTKRVFWATQRYMENVLAIMVDRLFFIMLFLGVRNTFAIFAKMLFIRFICFYLWLFLCNVSTFFTRHCKYEYDVSNFWTYPEKIFWKSLIWGLENVFLKTWTWIFRGSPDRRFGIEESGQAKAGLRMGVETRLAITSFVQKNMVQSLLNLVPFLNNHVLMVLNHWMMNQVFT